MDVKLIAYTIPVINTDPRRLIVLAVKVSSGKLHEKEWKHYLTEYPEKDVHNFVIDAVKYPVVLEHIVFTFLIDGISRVTSHQLVRHRLATYTQESQRYSESYMQKALYSIVEAFKNGSINPVLVIPECVELVIKEFKNEASEDDRIKCDKAKERAFKELISKLESAFQKREASYIINLFLNSSSIRKLLDRSDRACYDMHEDFKKAMLKAVEEAFVIPPSIKANERVCLAEEYLLSIARYYDLIKKGVPYEDARFVIPQAIKTRLMMTVNLRELIHIACLRLDEKSQWEIRELVKKMIDEVSRIVPEIYELIDKTCGSR